MNAMLHWIENIVNGKELYALCQGEHNYQLPQPILFTEYFDINMKIVVICIETSEEEIFTVRVCDGPYTSRSPASSHSHTGDGQRLGDRHLHQHCLSSYLESCTYLYLTTLPCYPERAAENMIMMRSAYKFDVTLRYCHNISIRAIKKMKHTNIELVFIFENGFKYLTIGEIIHPDSMKLKIG